MDAQGSTRKSSKVGRGGKGAKPLTGNSQTAIGEQAPKGRSRRVSKAQPKTAVPHAAKKTTAYRLKPERQEGPRARALRSAAERSEQGPANGPPTASNVLIHEERSVLLEPQDLTSRLDRYNGLTGQSRQYFQWVSAFDDKRACKGSQCASHLIFRKYHTLDEQPVKLSGGYFCQMRHHCQFCGAAHAVRALATAVPKVQGQLLEKPSLRPAMLTITCRDREDLADMVDELYGSWSTWIERRRNQAKGRRGHTALSLLDGGIMSAETKRGSGSGKWHFHAHGVVLAPPGLESSDFYGEWSSILGYTANLDFRYLKSAELINQGNNPASISEQLGKELLEVFKYALKTTEMEFEDRYNAACVLHGKKLIRPFGSLFNYKAPEELTEDLTEYDGLPYVELVYRYLEGKYKEVPNHGPNLADLDSFPVKKAASEAERQPELAGLCDENARACGCNANIAEQVRDAYMREILANRSGGAGCEA